MMEDSNGISDVAPLQYSQNETNEFSNLENVITSSDNFLFEALEPNVIEVPDSHQPFQLIKQDLTYDHGTTSSYHTHNTMNQNNEIDSLRILYPNVPSSSHSEFNSPPTIQNDDPEFQTTFVSSSQYVNARDSNELVYENVSSMVRSNQDTN